MFNQKNGSFFFVGSLLYDLNFYQKMSSVLEIL